MVENGLQNLTKKYYRQILADKLQDKHAILKTENLVQDKQAFSLTLYLIHCFEPQYLNHEHTFAIQLLKVKLLSENEQYLEQTNDILRSLLTQTKNPLHRDALKLARHLKKQSIL